MLDRQAKDVGRFRIAVCDAVVVVDPACYCSCVSYAVVLKVAAVVAAVAVVVLVAVVVVAAAVVVAVVAAAAFIIVKNVVPQSCPTSCCFCQLLCTHYIVKTLQVNLY